MSALISIKSLSPTSQSVANQSDLMNHYVSSRGSRLVPPRSLYSDSSTGISIDKFADSMGCFLFPHQVNLEILQRPISSSVFITSDKQPDYGASAVVVKLNGKKYLLTSFHVVVDKLRESVPDLYGVNSANGIKEIVPLDPKLLVRFVQDPYGDLAILKYEGNIEGVELAESLEQNTTYKSFAVGFPECFRQYYQGSSFKPILSYGLAALEGTNELLKLDDNIFFLPAPQKFDYAKAELPLNWIFYSGAATEGNSGGGLFNENGELIGIHYGFKTFSKPIDYQIEGNVSDSIKPAIFFSARELLMELK